MNPIARERLLELIKSKGPDVVVDHESCESLILDYFKNQHRPERSALVSALREGIPATLLSPPAIPVEVLLLNLSKRLLDHHPISDASARWAVETWAAALGHTTTKSNATQEPQAKVDLDQHRQVVHPREEKKRALSAATIRRLGAASAGLFGLLWLGWRLLMPQLPEVKSVRFFQRDSGGAASYDARFSQDTTGIVFSELSFSRTVPRDTEIEVIWTDPAVTPHSLKQWLKRGENKFVYGIGAEGSERWKEGRVNVDFLVAGRKIGNGTFDIFVPAVPPIKAVKFWESGRGLTKGDRPFDTQFSKSGARYINFELSFSRPSRQDIQLGATWRKPEDSSWKDARQELSVKSGTETHASGIGWEEAGHWTPGSYTVDLFLGSAKLGTGEFTVSTYDVPSLRSNVGPIVFFKAREETNLPPVEQRLPVKLFSSANECVAYQLPMTALDWPGFTAASWRPTIRRPGIPILQDFNSLVSNDKYEFSMESVWLLRGTEVNRRTKKWVLSRSQLKQTLLYADGWCPAKPWLPGDYEVRIDIRRQRVSSATFQILR